MSDPNEFVKMSDPNELQKGYVTWSFYDPNNNGRIARRTYSGDKFTLEANTPKGLIAIAGRYDWRSQRVDIETGKVVADASIVDHEHEQTTQRTAARSRIQALEAKQLRPLRELAIDPNNEEAANRLHAIDAEIAGCRRAL